MKTSHQTDDLFRKAADNGMLTAEEIISLLRIDNHSREWYQLLYEANRMSRDDFHNKGEKHFHIGVNASPCAFYCEFCSLAKKHGIFTEPNDFSQEQIVRWAKTAESMRADAINLMTTGNYGFEKLLEAGRLLNSEITVPLVANTRDLSHKDAEALIDAGFSGMYHAVRLGEGVVTPFKVKRRLDTIQVLLDTGLRWMTCIEPVGPEHTYEELARLMIWSREYKAVYAGAMRRVNFPGSPLEKYGTVTNLELAKIVAVSRLVMGHTVKAHCTHEPNEICLAAGANLFFPEVGSSPRDLNADTGEGRGKDIASCVALFEEMNYDASKPSNCFSATDFAQ